ncbi:MAG: glycosyltransferase family 2 protein [Acidimicrobiales bacterium]
MEHRSSNVASVIVNYNVADHLVSCVRSLRAEGVADVVVVDNASVDRSESALAAADPDARFVAMPTNLGFGTAANRGVALTEGPFVLVLNPDTVVEPGTVKALVDVLERDPAVAFVGPAIETTEGELYPSARTFPTLGDALGHAFLGFWWPANPFSRRYKMLDWDHRATRDVDWISGTCFLARRSAFEALGGFDEAYFMYAEDVDLCWRAWRSGWRVVYEPSARVVHAIGASSDQRPYRMIAAHHRSLLRFSAKSARGWRRLLLPFVAAGLAVRTGLAWLQRARRGRPHAAP